MIYSFTARTYDKVAACEDTSSGITHGTTYTDAMENLVAYLGEDSIEEVTLSLIADDTLFVPTDTIKSIKENMVW